MVLIVLDCSIAETHGSPDQDEMTANKQAANLQSLSQ